MNRMLCVVTRLFRENDSQDLIEYALLASLIAVAAITAVTQLGNVINAVFWQPIAQSF
jgi:Flp pilus assembly pilin Flp